MKKIALVLAVIVGVIGLQKAWAVNETAPLTITVTVRHLSVTIAPAALAFGTVNEGSITIHGTTVVVTNSGNTTETFSLAETVSAVGWSKVLVDAPAVDQYSLRALFAANLGSLANPDFAGSAAGVENDNILVGDTAADGDTFGRGADAVGVKGNAVASSATRNMFIQFRAGSGNTQNAAKTITVTVTANP